MLVRWLCDRKHAPSDPPTSTLAEFGFQAMLLLL